MSIASPPRRGRSRTRARPDTKRWIATLIRVASSHPAIEHVLDVIARLSERPVRTNFLLLGEPGTGKEGLARALHALVAPDAPYVKARTSGHGAEAQRAELLLPKTGALARARRGGMVVVEELCDLAPSVQGELLAQLKVPGGARLLAMSDRDPRAAVADGRLRHDLYYRVARIVLYLPPLRERPEDLPAAAVWMGNRILHEHRLRGEMRLPTDPIESVGDILLSNEAIERLQRHDWPGNFRELEAVLECALLLYRDDERALSAAAVERALSGPV